MTKITSFRDIPAFPRSVYECDVSWVDLERFLERHTEMGLDLNPDFQRGHVWTEDQQIAFVQYSLKGGRAARQLYLNHPHWSDFRDGGDYVLVDGLQRLTAAARFLNNEIPVFDSYYREFTDHLRFTEPMFRWNITELPKRSDVLAWYMDFNSGGTVHSREEITRVGMLLYKELQAEMEKV